MKSNLNSRILTRIQIKLLRIRISLFFQDHIFIIKINKNWYTDIKSRRRPFITSFIILTFKDLLQFWIKNYQNCHVDKGLESHAYARPPRLPTPERTIPPPVHWNTPISGSRGCECTGSDVYRLCICNYNRDQSSNPLVTWRVGGGSVSSRGHGRRVEPERRMYRLAPVLKQTYRDTND